MVISPVCAVTLSASLSPTLAITLTLLAIRRARKSLTRGYLFVVHCPGLACAREFFRKWMNASLYVRLPELMGQTFDAPEQSTNPTSAKKEHCLLSSHATKTGAKAPISF